MGCSDLASHSLACSTQRCSAFLCEKLESAGRETSYPLSAKIESKSFSPSRSVASSGFILGLDLGLVARVLRRCVVDLELFGESDGERLLGLGWRVWRDGRLLGSLPQSCDEAAEATTNARMRERVACTLRDKERKRNATTSSFHWFRYECFHKLKYIQFQLARLHASSKVSIDQTSTNNNNKNPRKTPNPKMGPNRATWWGGARRLQEQAQAVGHHYVGEHQHPLHPHPRSRQQLRCL
ncbi:hypothetical protein JHK82_043724 [Glycine max]|nr:hypothetical protein JHK86_043600 [Glycine max]KAG4957890.1 hypothetical protein JHK85_044270 [Glycine max]KAG5106754.1 hypothetical protein JHK82_043724 [Glycine max]